MSTNDCATHYNVIPILDNSFPIGGKDEYITRKQVIDYGAEPESLAKYKSDNELIMLNDIKKITKPTGLFFRNVPQYKEFTTGEFPNTTESGNAVNTNGALGFGITSYYDVTCDDSNKEFEFDKDVFGVELELTEIIIPMTFDTTNMFITIYGGFVDPDTNKVYDKLLIYGTSKRLNIGFQNMNAAIITKDYIDFTNRIIYVSVNITNGAITFRIRYNSTQVDKVVYYNCNFIYPKLRIGKNGMNGYNCQIIKSFAMTFY